MKPQTLIILGFTICTLMGKGQDAYFATGSAMTVGIKLIDGGAIVNSGICQVKQNGKIMKFTPYQVNEYGFENGRVYISKEIQKADSTERIFLERLFKGQTSLFYYRAKGIRSFFIEKDSVTFVEVPKQNKVKQDYSDQLLNLTGDCPEVSDAAKLAGYNKNSLIEFVSRYNNCELKPFPFLKYGLFVGMIRSKPVKNSYFPDEVLAATTFDHDYSFYFGLFADAPLKTSDFSVCQGLGIYQSSFSYSTTSDSCDYDILIDQTTVRLPLQIRYTIPALNFRPYFNAGLNYSYNLRNESTIYKAVISNDIIQYQTPAKEDLISDHQLGYGFGFGIQCYLNYKRMVFIEIRYGKEYSMKSENMFNKRSFELISGINF